MLKILFKRRWEKFDYSIFLTYVVLLSLFFIRLSFGTNNGDFDETNSITIPFFNFEAFIIVVVFYFYSLKIGVDKFKITRIVLIITPVLILQIFYSIIYHINPINGETINYFFRFTKAFFFLFGVLIFSFFFYNSNVFYNIFRRFLKLAVWFALFSYLFHIFLGTSMLLHHQATDNYYRVMAFFSEPSACSAPFAALFLISIYEKEKLYIILSLLAIFLTKSPTNFLTLIVSCLVFALLYRKFRIIFFIGILFSFTFITYLLSDFPLVEYGEQLFYSDSDVSAAVGRLLLGLYDIQSGGEQGSNFRYQGVQTLIDDMRINNLLLTGYGFNSSAEFFISKYGGIKDFSLLFNILFSYGILGVITFYFLVIKSAINAYNKDFNFFLIYIPFIIANTINSAQGFVMYQITFLGLFVFLNQNVIEKRKFNETDYTII